MGWKYLEDLGTIPSVQVAIERHLKTLVMNSKIKDKENNMEDTAIYEVATRQEKNVINFEEYTMSTSGVLRQIAIIQEVMSAVMHKDEHFGTIPGTSKPSLYKPGAEKLSLVFRLRPEYEIRRSDIGNGHREYEVVCTLYHIPTGQSVGQGVGSATTMEGKYRYRGGEKEGTGLPVPKEYWNLKKDGKKSEAQSLIGGSGFAPGKIEGKWEICSIGEKTEHDNPADYYNTILKMAKKRAHVDAILTATAASDIFTQDIEDMPEVIQKTENKKKESPPLQEPQLRKTEQPQGDQLATEKQKRLVWAKLKEAYTNDNDAKAGCVSLTGKKSSKDWTNADVQKILDHLNRVEKPMFPSTPEPDNDILTPEKCYELAEIYKGKIETAINTTDLETWYQATENDLNQIKGIEMDAYAEIMKAYDKRWKEVGE